MGRRWAALSLSAARMLRPLLLLLGALAASFALVYIVTLVWPGARSMIDRQFIFFPEKELAETPAQWGLSFEDVRFTASDGVKLHGWYVPGSGEVTWLWFHGNAGNISHRLEDLMLLHRNLDVNVFLFDYRGYGLSEGQVSEEGTYRDAAGALDYLLSRQDVDPQKIVYFGRSLGAAVAVWLASEHEPYGLVLESPFTSVKDMAQKAYPRLPLYLLVRTKYDSLSKIGGLSCPILILHGDEDEIVPIGQGRKLYDAATEPKSFYEIQGAAHNNTYIVGGEPYFRTLADFVESLGKVTRSD